MADTNIIELNGKRYDALTGRLIISVHSKIPNTGHPGKPPKVIPGTVIDDFIRHRQTAKRQVAAIDVVKATATKDIATQNTAAPRHKIPKNRHQPQQLQAHTPERARTLMRRSVSKPPLSLKARLHVQTWAKPTFKSPKPAFSAIDQERLNRSQQIAKSSVVSRFNHSSRSEFTKPTPVVSARPAERQFRSPVQSKADILGEAALARATSHNQPTPVVSARRGRLSRKLHLTSRTFKIVAIGMVATTLMGILIYQNRTSLDIRIAAPRAGITANMPSYVPRGFSFKGPVVYGPNQITINFQSVSDNHTFSIVEEASRWDSQTLRDSLSISQTQSYQTLQDAGRSILIYGQANAAWVSGGTLYHIQGDPSLSNQQLLGIAHSL